MILPGLLLLMVIMTAQMPAGRVPAPVTLSWPDYFGNRVFLPAGNPVTEDGIALGRRLFYEKALSSTDQMSCATCHQQAKAFTDGKRFSAGADGVLQPRNTMSLANLLWVRQLFWDGRAGSLEEQAVTPLTALHEMGQSLVVSAAKLQKLPRYRALFRRAFGSDSITGDRIVKALAQFERTLISANSRYDQYLQGKYQPSVSESNGITLFYANTDPVRGTRGAGCAHCHGGPKTYSDLFHNNGLDSLPADAGRQQITGQAYDKGRFRVAALCNIALTAPYMHDGRFPDLESVIDHYSEHVIHNETLSPFLQQPLLLTKQEKNDLLAFLHMLTDSAFVTDPRFSNPFNNN
ncbi:cytochrome-c peroxidase [Chitinophaga sp. G-6-1-13]|uniref:Methylamine utilization protein MauG n=1 Tax=Chitinophaga fulva TaxID=2728842 RepID=A0A848GPR7_9BACT|nr:cytochrome c peroxidase [Chitinophaga fulva]NML40605.1 cytochrome-c peroxidase [Chitinophaga fulva]